MFRCWVYFFISLSLSFFVCGNLSEDLSRCSSNGYSQKSINYSKQFFVQTNLNNSSFHLSIPHDFVFYLLFLGFTPDLVNQLASTCEIAIYRQIYLIQSNYLLFLHFGTISSTFRCISTFNPTFCSKSLWYSTIAYGIAKNTKKLLFVTFCNFFISAPCSQYLIANFPLKPLINRL